MPNMIFSKSRILFLIFSLSGYFQLNVAASYSVESCCKRIGTTLNCVRCGLSELPLSLMDSNITRLDLSKNEIRTIPNGSFEHMASLKMLNVSGNPLQHLNKESFRGLNSIEQFAIGRDYFTRQWYSAEIFSSLTNVTSLCMDCLYPVHLEPGFLLHMRNIKTLTIGLADGAVLGKEFSKLESLRTLHLTGDSKFGSKSMVKINLTEASLASVPQIEELTVTYVLRNMTPNALKPLINLKQLRLLLNLHFPVKQAFTAVKNMKSATLTHAILDGSHDNSPWAVTKDLLDSPNFDNLTLISVQNTNLMQFDIASVYALPRLEYLNAGFNSFFGSKEYLTYSGPELLTTKLKAISVNGMYLTVPDHKFHNIYFKQSLDTFPKLPRWIKVHEELAVTGAITTVNMLNATDVLSLAPPGLQFVYLNQMKTTMLFIDNYKTYKARADNNIIYIDLSYTALPRNFSKIKIIGLNKLEGLNLRGCDISYLHQDQLRNFPSLVYLDLQKNSLNISYFAKATQVSSSKLQYLYLGYNHIKYLPTDLIRSLTFLQSVSFRGNPLVEITLDIKNNVKLELLDFSDCTLVNLTDSFMQQLDGLRSLQSNKTKQMTLNLSNNRFECSCSTLAMIQWLQNTQVDIINKQSIKCTHKNGSVAMVDLDFSLISEECKTPTKILMIIMTPVALVTLLLVGIVLIHRYQWQLKWRICKTKRRIRLAMTSHTSGILLEQMQFDAFIVHDHSDDDWVTNQLYDNLTGNHKLELCLAQKDFMGGTPIAENIAHAINNSRKTVLVVTPAFVKSEWCLFEMHMAIAVKGMSHIVVILKEEVAVSEMGRTLRMILQTICYIEYPEEEAGLDLFWTKVVRAIKTQ